MKVGTRKLKLGPEIFDRLGYKHELNPWCYLTTLKLAVL